MQRRLTVLLAEDHAVVREGTRQILDRDPSIEVVGEAADGAEAVSLAAELEPDVVLLDLALPVLNGIEATKRIRSIPDPPYVVLLSAYDDEVYVSAAIESGASGYMLKTAHAEDVIAAIRAAARGEIVLHPAVARKLLSKNPSDEASPLTDRELEILRLAGQGLGTREIASSLSLSTRTIEAHLTTIFNKLGATNRTEAIARAAARGWLHFPRELE
jgi:two-component system, NarL family, response regulator LiaR